MKTKIRTLSVLAIALVALVMPVVTAMAQGGRQEREGREPEPQPRIAEVRIAVHDVKTREDVGSFRVDETLEVRVGDRLRLRLVAVPENDQRGERYPSARFTGPVGERPELTVTEVKAERGSALLEVHRFKDGDTFFRYEILDDLNIDRRLIKGTVAVRIVGEADEAPPAYEDRAEQYARRVVQALYQGILMRDPDPSASERIERIAREGHRVVVQEAMIMGDSRESRIEIYGRGVTQEQRLLAMYQHLMGLDEREIPENDWRLDLQRLRDGRIPELVNLMVQSREFRTLYGYGP